MLTKYSFQDTPKKKIPCLTKEFFTISKILSWPKSHVQQKIPCQNFFFQWPTKIHPCLIQKIHTTINLFSHTHVHSHETRLTHSNKISIFIKNEFVQPSLHIKFSWLQCPQNSSQNTFNNTKKYIHCQISWVINIVQVTPCQITRQFKNAPRPRLQHDQPYNAKFQQEQITTNDNVSTPSFQ